MRKNVIFYSSSPPSEHKICLVGLDNAGKTTILYQFLMNEVVHTSPTIGSNVEEVSRSFEVMQVKCSTGCWWLMLVFSGCPDLVCGCSYPEFTGCLEQHPLCDVGPGWAGVA